VPACRAEPGSVQWSCWLIQTPFGELSSKNLPERGFSPLSETARNPECCVFVHRVQPFDPWLWPVERGGPQPSWRKHRRRSPVVFGFYAAIYWGTVEGSVQVDFFPWLCPGEWHHRGPGSWTLRHPLACPPPCETVYVVYNVQSGCHELYKLKTNKVFL